MGSPFTKRTTSEKCSRGPLCGIVDARTNEYCSRACCMYSLKLSQLVHEYAGAEVHEIYRDIRSFGKGYEEFYNRTVKMGVHFYHGKVKSIEKSNDHLHVAWDEAFHGQPDHVDVDMVILATGFEPQADMVQVAAQFGISRSRDGFFLERHPKLAPVETTSEGRAPPPVLASHPRIFRIPSLRQVQRLQLLFRLWTRALLHSTRLLLKYLALAALGAVNA